MIEYRNGDLLKQDDINVICHQTNCFCTMKSGIAKQIVKIYPTAEQIDTRTRCGDKEKLGKILFTHIGDKTIVNMYGQYGYGTGERQTDYDALRRCLEQVKKVFCRNKVEVIGFPDHLGCGLAGGNWQIVHNMIKDVFKDVENKIVIVKLPE